MYTKEHTKNGFWIIEIYPSKLDIIMNSLFNVFESIEFIVCGFIVLITEPFIALKQMLCPKPFSVYEKPIIPAAESTDILKQEDELLPPFNTSPVNGHDIVN